MNPWIDLRSRTLVLTAILLLGAGAIAQDNGVLGVKAGYNSSTFLGSDPLDRQARTGYHVGAFIRPRLSDAVSLNVELLYSTKGVDRFRNTTSTVTASQTLNYLDAPVFLSIHLGSLLELHAGGYAEYLLSSAIRSSSDLSDAFTELDERDYRGLGYGLLGGAALNFGRFQVGGRYNYGLSRVADTGDAQLFVGDARNAVTQLYLALALF